MGWLDAHLKHHVVTRVSSELEPCGLSHPLAHIFCKQAAQVRVRSSEIAIGTDTLIARGRTAPGILLLLERGSVDLRVDELRRVVELRTMTTTMIMTVLAWHIMRRMENAIPGPEKHQDGSKCLHSL